MVADPPVAVSAQATDVTVKLNEAAIARLLNSTVGPVGQHIGREADRVATAANQR